MSMIGRQFPKSHAGVSCHTMKMTTTAKPSQSHQLTNDVLSLSTRRMKRRIWLLAQSQSLDALQHKNDILSPSTTTTRRIWLPVQSQSLDALQYRNNVLSPSMTTTRRIWLPVQSQSQSQNPDALRFIVTMMIPPPRSRTAAGMGLRYAR